MSFSENEQEQVFKRRFTSTKRQGYNKTNSRPQTPSSSTPSIHPETPGDEFSASVSWPILLAVIPAIGAFFAGSAEVWSDFIMILLTLYYVYKWLTGKTINAQHKNK